MKNSTVFMLLIGLIGVVGLSFTTLTEELSIDTDNSVITWRAEKVTGSHDGTLKLKGGALTMEDGKLSGGNFEIDMTSLAVTDLQPGKGKEKLEGHLRSPDFFSVEEHPTASFVITKVVPRGKPGDYRITGDVTIKGKTKEIRFNALMEDGVGAPTATAEITLDRTDFDIRYGSGSFFDNLGDKTIYDEFQLGVTLAVKN